MKNKFIIYFLIVIVVFAVIGCGYFIYSESCYVKASKPIIYLYPEQNTDVNVQLGRPDLLTCSYPKYLSSWNVNADPDGHLFDLDHGRDLYALYYESNLLFDYGVEKDGFVVKGEDSISFLEEKLSVLGLTDREAEEFIVYWLPELERSPYNYIRFLTLDEINDNMPLDTYPKPDTKIRVWMSFKGLDEPVDVEKQVLRRVRRKGFTVVEWGGFEIK